ncbi:GntR family transcriptional regulator [Nonomuraea africana]|uniref:GntR family transcriptional regulator n=1 Tax=Nonomuraea africana TaxID=46171 RepID=UPI00340B1A01
MLDRDGPIPLYRQIAERILERILSGALKPGDPVLSEAEIEAEFDVARATARRVARQLRDWGLVHTVQGEGTYVGEPGVPRNRRGTPKYHMIAEEIGRRIHNHEFLPNRPIPSEKELMREYGVAKVTAREAVARLREQGLVFTVPYRGSYVSPRGSTSAP